MDREEVGQEPQSIEQETELFRDIERSGALPEEVSASDAVTAVLCALVMRLSRREARELVTTLPPTLQSLIDYCARNRMQRPATFDRPTFLYGIADQLAIDTDAAFRLAHAVFAAVRARLPAQEIDEVEAMLSYDLAELWSP